MKNVSQQLRKISKEISAKKITVLVVPKISGIPSFKVQIQAETYSQALKASKAMFDSHKYTVSIIGG